MLKTRMTLAQVEGSGLPIFSYMESMGYYKDYAITILM